MTPSAIRTLLSGSGSGLNWILIAKIGTPVAKLTGIAGEEGKV
ncbi:hypothetical protein [Aliterella atlantica]